MQKATYNIDVMYGTSKIDIQRETLKMREFFFLLDTITQAAKVTCMATAKEIIAKVEIRIQYLSENQEKVLRPIALNKLLYMERTLKIELSEEVKSGLADLSLLDMLKEMLSCVKSDNILRNAIYKNVLIEAVNNALDK